jgi:carboxypeptidase Taq
MGYFPTYSLGNILSVQLWERALQDEPSIPEGIANGRFSPLLGWLRENVHRHGRKFPPRVLVERATGRGLDVAPYAAYLKRKFGEIYNI